MADWKNLVVGAYYGCEISPLSDSGAIQPDVYFWWNGSGWVDGRLPHHLWRAHKECRRRFRYSLPVSNEE
jgi:hypothetical protein